VVLAELMRHVREDRRDRHPDRLLRVANHAEDGQATLLDRAQERLEHRRRRLLEIGRPEDCPTEYFPDHPQLLIALLGLEAVERHHDPAVLGHRGAELLTQVLVAGPHQREVDLQQVLDVPLRDRDRCLLVEIPPDFGPRPMLSVAQVPNPRDHVEPIARPFDLAGLGPR
jgi:hypothetical protein